MIVFIINGAPRVGKDTFIELLQEITKENVVPYSSIDWVKEKAKNLGWDGVKDTKGRQFLSDIKDACTEYADIPFQKIVALLSVYNCFPSAAPEYFCTNIREPEEIFKLNIWCMQEGIPCCSVWIRRREAEQKALDTGFISNGDTQFMDYDYDWVIHNDGSKEDFRISIEQGLKEVSA